MLKKLGFTCLVLCLFLLTPACTSRPPEENRPLKLGLLRVEDNLPFFVGQAENLYEKKGLQVELITFNSARERDLALEAGEIQGELADLLAAALIMKGGTPIKVVSLGLGTRTDEGRFAILAAPHSDITAPADLKGVPLAISRHTIIHYLAEEMVREAGLNPEDLEYENIPDMNLRLDSLFAPKGIKAALLPDPLAALAEKMGARTILDDTKLKANLSQTVIIFQEKTLLERPREVKGILECYQQGAMLLKENPERYQALFIEKARIPKPLEGTYQIPVFQPLVLPTEDMVRRVMNWMTEKGLLEQPYQYEELVAPGYLPSNPE